ncbi:MAG: NUDIX domain-containing protein [Patescibacteria group bacterium]
MTNHFAVNVEAAIYRDGRWLVGVRGKGESEAPGLLSFVGGTVEHTDPLVDTLESALVREIEEELGVRVAVNGFVNDTTFVSKKGNHVINIVFLCTIVEGEPRIVDVNENEELLWLTSEEILSYPNVPPWLSESVKKAEGILKG